MIFEASGGRAELRAIARRAMAERGLQPDFSPAARAEATAQFLEGRGFPSLRRVLRSPER